MTLAAMPELPSFAGLVVHGHKRGRILGFPTANIAVDSGGETIEDGVFSCWAKVPDTAGLVGATVSVGRNPTFDDVTERRVEAYLHDLDAMLYGMRIAFFVVHRLRDTMRFATVADLIDQTARDVERSRRLLEGERPNL